MSDEGKLQTLWDERSITHVMLDFGHILDRRDWDGHVACFTDPVNINFKSFSFYVGREEHVRHYSQHILTGMLHLLSNEIIEIDGDAATGQCNCEMPCVYEGESYICACRYDDVLVKQDGQWKFKRRTVTIYYFVPLKEGWAREPMQFPGGEKGAAADLD